MSKGSEHQRNRHAEDGRYAEGNDSGPPMPNPRFGYRGNAAPHAAQPGTWQAPPNQPEAPHTFAAPPSVPFMKMYNKRGQPEQPTMLPYSLQHGVPRLSPGTKMTEGDYVWNKKRGQWIQE